MRAQVVLFDGFDEVDAIAPFEVLANAAAGGAAIEVELVALDGPRPVTGSHGATVAATAALGSAPDLLVVPGGGWNDHAEQGAWGEARRGRLPAAIAAAHAAGATIASVCTGGMLLATAGLLEGRPATTHHGAHSQLAEAGARLVDDARVVDDGDIVTCGGVTSGLDMALHLVERYFGAQLADAIAREMEHDRRGPVSVR